jgi:3-hydroxyacyl-CoA dehydrogenase
MTDSVLFESAEVRLGHRDGRVAVLEFLHPRPRIGPAILEGLNRGIDIAEAGFLALVVYAPQGHFAYGADLDDGFAAAERGDLRLLEAAIARFQQTKLRVRYARVPVIAAVRGAAISGGCELLMHCARVVAHRESFIGLREALVGVLPGGGGIKEMARKASAESGDFESAVSRHFITVAAGRAGNPATAKELGYLRRDDVDSEDADLLGLAVAHAISLSSSGYQPPGRNPLIRSAGGPTFRSLAKIQEERAGQGKLTAHQCEINLHIAEVICGGKGEPGLLDEAAFLALEREHFLALVQLPKTQERLRHLRETGEVLRN